MSADKNTEWQGDLAPGDELAEDSGVSAGVRGYLIGLVVSLLLTAASFLIIHDTFLWKPGIPVALGVLAVAQMGIHLVFFLHLNTGPDNTNNILALAFGVLIVAIVVSGSLWIMSHLNNNMMPIERVMDLHQQR
ncbi:MAG: cytochrome o ubiquinol oxidase subunit IV [Rudaea sp.]|uniref:cytochrome o ubiquinol oxidase subunit IV n=1 Tax=Rudaea sp. 3F27F6 TaxID=2502208 RepID=UPI0010F4DA08|nr:cytochrome o ubiquinol oxidase subunit IV [Rudaea sp. 3F27F6]MBR0343961.1 cytochrome o ubiquinol oxidase subunit IV [Rudaea sp.]